MQPRLRPFFRDPSIIERLQRVAWSTSVTKNRSSGWDFELELYREVTFLAKQALLCIEDGPINEIIDAVLQFPFFQGEKNALLLRVSMPLTRLLELCK